jgi:neurofibromin 1
MLAAFTDTYIGDQMSRRKASEVNASNIGMIRNVLKFLDASPSTLFDNPPTEGTDKFYEDNFEAFASCLVSANDEIRQLASVLAKRLLSPDVSGILFSLRKAKRLDSQGFKIKFWRLTSLVLNAMVEKGNQQGDEATLRSIHSYLSSRLLLLNSISVSRSWAGLTCSDKQLTGITGTVWG